MPKTGTPAASGSVFGPGEGAWRSIGVEEELLLVDAETAAPVPVAPRVLRHSSPASAGFTVVAELHREMLELVSSPQRALADAFEGILAAREFADDAARRVGARAAPLATSPLPGTPHPSAGDRYRQMVDRYGALPRRCMTCGLHVHVSIESPAEGVQVLDRIRVWLPVLRALAANSPFHDGVDTGYASYRFSQWSAWPSSGPTDLYGDLAAYERSMSEVLATGALLDEHMWYPDARLSRHVPTVEIRVADVPLLPDATAAIAALCRGLVTVVARQARAGVAAPSTSSAALRLASWTASLEGLDGQLVHPQHGVPAPAAEVVAALLDVAADGLDLYGEEAAVRSGIARILREGNGASRQRARAASEGLPAMVLGLTSDSLRAGEPPAASAATA
ncbi:glutamate--cysteine ligase [Rathayibacter sp. YIM 133350]|uniref:carboxylate-amine ligase n=1 Tax=Rathayibacter sp. YIM 133350 TaxID=3131992 RepID=UPI00307EFFFA